MAITVTMDLEDDAAAALAQMAKRFTWEDAKRLSNPHKVYAEGGSELDRMLDGICALQRALAAAGHEPR